MWWASKGITRTHYKHSYSLISTEICIIEHLTDNEYHILTLNHYLHTFVSIQQNGGMPTVAEAKNIYPS